MMKTLTNFGIVLVVLAMVTSSAFARNDYIGPVPGPPIDDSWCNPANWSLGVSPTTGDSEETRVDNGETVVVGGFWCEFFPYGADVLQIRSGGVQVGTSIANGDPVDLGVTFFVDKLKMSDSSTSDYTCLNIVNGDMIVDDRSKDLFEDGSGCITIAAGSSLTFKDGEYFGDSNGDGCGDTYTLDIAGDFTVEGDRLEHRGGHLIVNLTGNAIWTTTDKTTRLSTRKDAIATINITDNATYNTDKLELNQGRSGADCDYSLAIKISGNGTWNGAGEEIKDQGDGAIFNLAVTGNGTFITKDLNINDDDGEINIFMDSGTIDIEDDIDMNAGDIVITGGTFDVEDDFELGDDGVATITVSGTADVWIDDLYMGDDAQLTIDDVRMDLDDLKEMKGGSSIDLIGCNAELVIKNADDQEDLDEINDLIDAGQIGTSEAGKAVIADYGVSHEDRLTVRVVTPVTLDVKPGTCPNPLRLNFIGQGSIKVAIVGSADLDVLDVDVATLSLDGVAPTKSSYKDISTFGAAACECTDLGPDGILDLELKFNRSDILDALAEREGDLTTIAHRSLLPLTLTGTLYEALGCLPIQGSDCIAIRNRGAIKARK